MIPKDILKQVKHIELFVSRLVTTSMLGHYSSIFKGNGLEFAEVREYQYGDDIRAIDWNVSARYGKPFIKKFVEERELNVIIMIDMSASMRFSTRNKTKNAIAAELATILALSAIKNNDKVGMMLFSETIQSYLPPSKRRNFVLEMIKDILCYDSRQKKTNLKLALNYLNNNISKESIIFLISDFWVDDYEIELKILNRRHDIIPICLNDTMEKELPSVGFLNLEGMEDGCVGILKTTDHFRDMMKKSYDNFLKKRSVFFHKLSLEFLSLTTDQNHLNEVISFFKRRAN